MAIGAIYGNNPPPPTQVMAKEQTISGAIEEFDPLIGRLEQLAGQLLSCADHIVGSRPNGVDNGEKNPGPSHLVWAINSRRQRLLIVTDHIEAEIQRIVAGLA